MSTNKLFSTILFTFLIFLTPLLLNAALITWDDEGGDGDWNNALNWSGDVLPTATDHIEISGFTVTIPAAATITVLAIELKSGAMLTIANTGVLNLGSDADGDAALYLNSSSGAIINNGTINITDANKDGLYTKGSVTNNGTIIITTYQDDGITISSSGSLLNNGTITVGDPTLVGDVGINVNSGGGTLTNAKGASIGIPEALNEGIFLNINSTINNSGTITIAKTGSGDNALEVRGTCNNLVDGSIKISNINAPSGEGIRVENDGTFDNAGILTIDIVHDQTSDAIENQNIFTSSGIIEIGCDDTTNELEINGNPNAITFGGTINFNIAGTSTENDEFDQIQPKGGNLDISSATAHLEWNFIPSVGNCFKIIDGSSTVVGPFANITSSNSGILYTITYNGDSNKEVEICITGVTDACSVPTNVASANITGAQADFSWDAVGGTSGYNWKLVAAGAGSAGTAIVEGSTTTATTVTVTGLSCMTSYDFHVQSDCGSTNQSAFSAAHNFMSGATPCITCHTPENVSVSNIMSTTADLSWNASTGASSYNWKVVVKGAGSDGTAVASNTGEAGTTASATGLSPSTEYDLHVQSDCGGGDLSTFSAASGFTTTSGLCLNGTGLSAIPTMNTYDLIRSVLGPGGEPSETPDCGHAAFGDHITQVNDATLGKNVFAFHMHVNEDNDRCINFDRQRNEIKTYSPSPDNLKGVLGETVQYKWKFKLPAGFQSSAKFTHIHQLKSVGASDNEDSMPQITFTTRKGINGNPDQLELRYAEDFSQITWAQTDLTPFKGAWVEVIETVTYGDWGEGKYAVDIKKVSDGSTLLTHTENATRMWKTDASFIRPKWGIYRSLEDKVDLRDEVVCFADFCIEETSTATPCAAVTTYFNAKNITSSSAELTWGGVPGAVNYNWKVVLGGAGAAGAAVAEGTSPKTSTVVSSLDPSTSYDLHVEADCGSATTTGFSVAYNFMTTIMTDEVCAAQIGEETGSSSSRGPIHQGGATTSDTRYSRYFQVFTQAELAAIDLVANNEITELRWFITTTDVIDELGDAPFKIYIKNSTATVASENTWAALTSGATLALDTKLNATNNFPGEAGWMPFTLDAPFVYTGGALEIAVEWNWASVAFTNGGTVKWQYSNFVNDVMVRALGETEHSTGNLTKSSTSKQRANIQICYTPGVPPSCPAPSNLNATNITINSADLSWDAVSNSSSYNWKVVGVGAGGNAMAIASGSTAGLTASATNLSCLTAYDLHVQADCGGGDLSTFSKAHTFVTLSGVTPTTTTIGTGTSSSSSRGPIQQGGGTSTTRYSRFNQIFTQAELLTAGLTANSSISEIQWYLNSTEKIAGSGDAPMKVYIKNSAATEATVIPWSTAIAGSTMVVDRVFNTTKNFPGVTGWMPFTFNTPFVYTGGALEIGVEWDYGSISIPAFTGSDASNPNGGSIKWRYSTYTNNVVARRLGSGSHGTSNLSFASDPQQKDRANIQFITVPASSCPTCAISNLTASTCPNDVLKALNSATGQVETVTETITIQDANNPTCAASIEVPVCADGSSIDITFTTTGDGAASSTFNLFVDGALKAVGGTSTGSGNFAFNNIITPVSADSGEEVTGEKVTPTGTPDMSIEDPCNCDNPMNIRNNIGQITHFHDILTVSTGAANQTIVLSAGSNAFLDASLAQVADNVVLGVTNASGILETEFFHADRVAGTITILNQTTGIAESFFIEGCVFGECTPIPTMSEWGLLIFALLIMNLSIFFVQRRELI